MNAQSQIVLDLSKVSILSQLLSGAVLTDNRDQVLNIYNRMLAEMSRVGKKLISAYDFAEARRA